MLCDAEFVFWNIEISLHFLSFLNTDMMLVIEISSARKQEMVYPVQLPHWGRDKKAPI